VVFAWLPVRSLLSNLLSHPGGTGECDADHQCAAGLECFQRSNGEEIPGCDVTDAPSGGWDYCYKP
jgi:hypothetical protein